MLKGEDELVYAYFIFNERQGPGRAVTILEKGMHTTYMVTFNTCRATEKQSGQTEIAAICCFLQKLINNTCYILLKSVINIRAYL